MLFGKNKPMLMLVALLLGIALVVSACAPTPEEEEVEPENDVEPAEGEVFTLEAATAWTEHDAMNDAFWMFAERLEERSDGQVQIEFVGGPEVFSPFDLIEAITDRTADIANTAGAYYTPQLPETDSMKLSTLSPQEEREVGYYDYLNELHQEKVNAVYLGRCTPGMPYLIYTNERVEEADFSGLNVRVTPIYRAFVEELGASTMTTDPGELYTAMERGVADAYGWPALGITDFGWEEVTDYVIEPGFYQVDVNILINQDAWNELPEDIQELMMDIMIEIEEEAIDHYEQRMEEEREVIIEEGVEVLELTDEEAEKYLDSAYEAGWEVVLENSPEHGPELQELLTE